MAGNKERVERRLAAIFAADVAGYSRLMEQDEVGTLRTLTAHREIMDRLIAEHGGRIANTAGDSVLAEFPSAVDAVQCAVAVQEALAASKPGQTQRSAPPIPDRDSCRRRNGAWGRPAWGRREHCCPAGEPCRARRHLHISADTHAYVRQALTLGFDDLGPQEVKNIDEPVHVYRVRAPALPSHWLDTANRASEATPPA